MAVRQNLVPLVNIKIAGKWVFIPLKMVLIGIDPYPYIYNTVLVVVAVISITVIQYHTYYHTVILLAITTHIVYTPISRTYMYDHVCISTYIYIHIIHMLFISVSLHQTITHSQIHAFVCRHRW